MAIMIFLAYLKKKDDQADMREIQIGLDMKEPHVSDWLKIILLFYRASETVFDWDF